MDESAPKFEHFDYDLAKILIDTRDIDVDYEGDFVTTSESANDVSPLQLSRVPKLIKVEPVHALLLPSCSKHIHSVSDHECQKRVRSLEKQCQEELR